jgi:hypothetical protein
MEYDQRGIIKFLWNDGIDVHDIADRLQAQFAEHAYKPRVIRFWIAEIWLSRQDLHDEIRTGRPPLDDLDTKILAILDKSPFESVYSISERLFVADPTVLRLFHNSFCLKSFYLHWVPHLLTDDLHKRRREHARAILPLLHAAERYS